MNDVGHGHYEAKLSDGKMRADRLRSVKAYRENTAWILYGLAACAAAVREMSNFLPILRKQPEIHAII
jgi:hypothetical protein